MKHLTLLVGLVLLCIQQPCWGIPLGTALKEEQLVYSYLGRLNTGSSASSEILGRWGVAGNLTVQMLEKSLVLQLHDLQTTLYNGYREDLKDSEHYENIPNEVNILEKPFVLHSDFSLSLTPNEPLWSVNFKRGLASNFHEVIEGVNQEKFVFGNCETKTESKDGVMVKIINHNECDDVQLQHLTNVRPAPAPQGFNPINRKTVVHVKFAPGRTFPPESIHSESMLTYTSMPKVPYNQHILQHSELNLMSSSAEFDHIDISQLTEKKDIFFEYSDEITQGRHQYETDPQVLTQQYLQGYESFESFFERTPLENRKNSTEDPIDDMYMALYTMPDAKDITHLKEKILSKNNDMMYKTFLSLLSYVGTEQAVNAINEIISRSEFEKIPLSGLHLLSTFPNYITDLNDELVQRLEGMLEFGNVKTETMTTAQILSFASVVSRGHKLKQLSEERVLKYRTLYFDKFSASEDYETKFNYLLGLINMAEALSTEFQISIITNTTLPAKLRSLAIVGFKNTLKITAVEKLYDTLWPVIQNDEENFDLRIECLDLLLSANLTEDQFYSIVQQSKKYLKSDMRSKHLANYVISTIESIQNKTAYREPLSDLASQVIQNKEFPVYPRAYWQTGNYRLSYSDVNSNLGAYVQARLIGAPEIGTVSSFQLSYNQFDWSFDRGVYSIYVKLQGIPEITFRKDFFHAMAENGAFPTGLPKLLDILKKYNYKMKDLSSKISADIVIFNDDKVVFAKTITEHNNGEQEIEYLYQEIIFTGFFLHFPLLDYIQMPSLLGTSLRISNDMQSIQKFTYPSKNNFSFRSSWYFQTWLEAYNPILDTSVSSFKYYGDESAIRSKLSINLKRMVMAWVPKNDTFNWVSAKLIGTDVDETILHKFCPHCEGVTEVSTNLYTDAEIKNYAYLGAKCNSTKEQHEHIRDNRNFFLTVKDVHQSNTDAVPFAQALIVPLHTYRHNYYLKPELSRTSSRSVENKEGGVITRVHFNENEEKLSSTVDPYVDRHQNYTLTVITKDLDEPDLVEGEKRLTFWEISYESKSIHNYTDENGKLKVKYTTNVHMVENIIQEKNVGYQFCFSRAELLPPASPNRFQISPPEDASALTILTQEYKTKDTIWTQCKDDRKTTLNEVYTNQEDHTKQILESSFYKQCLEESKELKYTPTTNSCIAAYVAMSRYDKYRVNMEPENTTDMNFEGLDSNALITYEKVDEDKFKLSLFLLPFLPYHIKPNESYFEHTLYFPYKSRNPVAEVNKDQDIFRGLKRSCNISPQEIKTFTDKHIPNTETNKQIALVECNSHSQRLVEFQKGNNHQIDLGFTSRNHTIVATADGSKVKVTLNGEELKDSVLNLGSQEKISVRFLDENAVFIADDYIGIYYNTEFINIKTAPMYKLLSCGLCDE